MESLLWRWVKGNVPANARTASRSRNRVGVLWDYLPCRRRTKIDISIQHVHGRNRASMSASCLCHLMARNPIDESESETLKFIEDRFPHRSGHVLHLQHSPVIDNLRPTDFCLFRGYPLTEYGLFKVISQGKLRSSVPKTPRGVLSEFLAINASILGPENMSPRLHEGDTLVKQVNRHHLYIDRDVHGDVKAYPRARMARREQGN